MTDREIQVLLFAGLAERLGRREVTLAGPATVGEIEARVREEWPELAGSRFRVAVNRRYAASDDAVEAGDEVALIPPVSGG